MVDFVVPAPVVGADVVALVASVAVVDGFCLVAVVAVVIFSLRLSSCASLQSFLRLSPSFMLSSVLLCCRHSVRLFMLCCSLLFCVQYNQDFPTTFVHKYDQVRLPWCSFADTTWTS